MKLVLLMYLEADEACVTDLLSRQGVTRFSRLAMEGLGPGSASGWYGEPLPYRSEMIIAIVPAARSKALLDAVAGCRGVEDSRHPIRAIQLGVEDAVSCLSGSEASRRPSRAPGRGANGTQDDHLEQEG